MVRWPTYFGVATLLLLGGCATRVEAGLANAPRLGATAAGEPRGDVISNGGDSCGRYSEASPLRGRIPPCPSVTRSSSRIAPALTAPASTGEGVVVPWVQHFYVGWPCPHSGGTRNAESVAWGGTRREAFACPAPAPILRH